MTYLYCITVPSAPGPPPATLGIDGGAVRRLGDAWVSDVEARPVRATVERIRVHDAVVVAALGTGSTPLPARFGQVFASDAECEQALSAQIDGLSASLARVAGMVEMTVLIRTQGTLLPDRSSGTAYLTSLARHQQAENDLRRAARSAHAQLAPYVRDSAERVSGGVATLSHLVQREALTEYRERAAGLPGVTVIGPNAPYSFGRVG